MTTENDKVEGVVALPRPVRLRATAIIAPDGTIAGVSPGGFEHCMVAWTQVVQSTGKFIPQLQKLGYKIREGVFEPNAES